MVQRRMKNFLTLLAICYFFTGCTTAVTCIFEEIKPHEVVGAGHEDLQGKLFRFICTGDEFHTYTDVRSACLNNISTLAHKKGYYYFSILQENNNTRTMLGSIPYFAGNSMLYNIYTTQTYSVQVLIRLLQKEELSSVSNYYKVSDYYTEEKGK